MRLRHKKNVIKNLQRIFHPMAVEWVFLQHLGQQKKKTVVENIFACHENLIRFRPNSNKFQDFFSKQGAHHAWGDSVNTFTAVLYEKVSDVTTVIEFAYELWNKTVFVVFSSRHCCLNR